MTDQITPLDPPLEGHVGEDHGLALVMRGNGDEVLFATRKKPLRWVSITEFTPHDVVFEEGFFDEDDGEGAEDAGGIPPDAAEVQTGDSPMGAPRRRGR